MVRTLSLKVSNKIKKAIPVIEKKIKIRINVKQSSLTIKGNEVNEFLVEKILLAIDFGFDVEDALLLKDEDFNLEFINVKEHTRRKNLEEVRARLIGTNGKAKRTIENLTGGVIVVHENEVGFIVDSEHLEQGVQGIISLIQGAKHGNVFTYLEKQNAKLRHIDQEDLGLREGVLNS
jgi:ribosomal RNA assembly protein